jgi:hypothetical protein
MVIKSQNETCSWWDRNESLTWEWAMPVGIRYFKEELTSYEENNTANERPQVDVKVMPVINCQSTSSWAKRGQQNCQNTIQLAERGQKNCRLSLNIMKTRKYLEGTKGSEEPKMHIYSKWGLFSSLRLICFATVANVKWLQIKLADVYIHPKESEGLQKGGQSVRPTWMRRSL